MKLNNIIPVIFLLSASFCTAQDKFEISGKLSKKVNDKKAMLTYVNADGKSVKDSTLVSEGQFSFTGTTAFGNRAYLSLLPLVKDTTRRYAPQDYQEFYLERGKYKVAGKDSIATAKINGAQAQTDYFSYKEYMGTMPEEWQKISQKYLKARSAKDSAEMKLLSAEAKILMPKMEAALDSFIFNHLDSYVSLDLVNDNKTSVIQPETFDRYYTALSPRVLNSFTGKKMSGKYEKAKQMFVGYAFNFTQNDVQGNPFTLASLKGKYVLVDFWASWCAPCRAENPNLLKAYKQLKEKNFEIVGISLDESKAAWLKALEKDGMPWTQVSDLKGFQNEVATKYGITAIPQNILVDPKGIIIAKNLRGEDLTQQLEKYIP